MGKHFKISIPITKPLVPDIKKYNKYLKDIFDSGILTNNGPNVLYLESKLKKLLNSQHSSVFCNGTVALMVALRALDISRGAIRRDIVTTPFTFPATVNVLKWVDMNPIFCDIDYDSMNITPKLVKRLMGTYVTAIMPVHVFGNPCDVKGFEELAKSYKKKLVYDAAHAFGVKIDGTGIGNFGDVSMFSFHPTKLFNTGEGGVLTYNDFGLDKAIKQLRNFGIKDEETGSTLPGINGKMNELQAAIGLCVMDDIKSEIKARKTVDGCYRSCLSNTPWIKLLDINDNVQRNYQYFPIRITHGYRTRDEIHTKLLKNGIGSRKYFYPLCSDFPHLREFRENLPVATKVSEEILCLPMYGSLKLEEIYKICSIITEN